MKATKVAFSGKMCSGKTTMAEFLVKNYGFTRIAIGDQIKKVSNMVIEDHEQLERYLEEMMPDFSANILSDSQYYWEQVKGKEFVKQNGIYLKNEAYRGMTQNIGDIVRKPYGEDVWIHLVNKEASKIIESGGKVVCDDVRLLPEKEIFEQAGYKVFRLEIEEEDQKQRILQIYKNYDPKALKHKTETDLDHVKFDPSLTFSTTELTHQQSYDYIEHALR